MYNLLIDLFISAVLNCAVL